MYVYHVSTGGCQNELRQGLAILALMLEIRREGYDCKEFKLPQTSVWTGKRNFLTGFVFGAQTTAPSGGLCSRPVLGTTFPAGPRRPS